MYKVYVEEYGTVWEPAEGGYDVEVSEVSLWDTFDDVETAKAAVADEMACFTDERLFEDEATYDYSTGDFDDDGNAITEEESAEFIWEADRSSSYYLGNGHRFICIDDEKPVPWPKVYVGYC